MHCKGYDAQAGAVTPPPFGEDGYKSQYALVGGIVGYAVGSTVISGCEVNAYVRATNRGVGGIAGALNGSASISNCTQNGLVWGSMTGNGGITGIIVSNTVSDCTVNGCVYGKYSYVGGVVAVTAGTAKIQNCKIENGVVHTGFKYTSVVTRIEGIIGGSWVAAPEVTGCKAINSKILSNATICAAIVGVANNGIVIKDCEVTDCFVDDTNEPENSAAKHEVAGILGWGKVSVDVSGCTVKNSTMVGNAYCSMIVGYADAPLTKITNCTADNCELRAGQSLGGILGAATKHAEISGCQVTNCTSAGTGAYRAGSHGEAQAGTEISNCKVENTSLSQPAAKNFIGGINAYSKVGELKVTDCKVIDIDIFGGGQGNGCVIGRSDFATIVKNCYVSGKIETATAGYNVGGIIGHINSGANAVDLIIDNCAVEADITGGYQVGGICGLSAGTGTTPIIISNVSYVGKLSALSAPANYPNANIAGIVGYANNASQNKPLYVVNAYARPSQIDITSKVTGGSGAIGGLFGYAQWNVSAFIGYSDLVRGKIYKDGVQIDGTQARVGGIAGVTCYTASASYGTLLSKNLYYDSSIGFGPTNDGQGAPDEVDCEGITEAKFTDGTLLSNLNAAVTAYNASEPRVATAKAWVAGADGYPVISGLPTK